MSVLFSELELCGVAFQNRIFVSPMCQYSSDDGMPTDWHLVHLGSRAVGGAALVMVEATAVSPEGRISPWDSGMWSEGHARIRPDHVLYQGARRAARHSARPRRAKGFDRRPLAGRKTVDRTQGGWEPVAPSPVPFDEDSPTPREMTVRRSTRTVAVCGGRGAPWMQGSRWWSSTWPTATWSTSSFRRFRITGRMSTGGTWKTGCVSPRNRGRSPRGMAQDLPLFVRISCTDWVDGGWSPDAPAVEFARRLKNVGVDLVDCSSGGLVPQARVPVGPGYQTPFAARIRRKVGIATGAVGMITSTFQAEQVVATGQADVVLLARELLRNPYWPLHAARELGADVRWPAQYLRAKQR